MPRPKEESLLAQWRCILACGVMILFPFQYGLDFGLIGGLQAMVYFLRVITEPHTVEDFRLLFLIHGVTNWTCPSSPQTI